MIRFQTTIGLEIHAQLNTKRKMFCGCNNDAGEKEPNSVVCPRCLGMPGTLPVANRDAIIKTIQLGLVFGCKIPKIAKFDRKHYFYPDLPKGYQISQYDMPFAIGGWLKIKNKKSKIKKIRLNRIHLEEDAGKLNHPTGADYSLVDLNRASTPLMEIVTEPDIHSPEEAKELMKIIQLELINQGISDADMEKGHLRCDANISITRRSSVVGSRSTNDKRQTTNEMSEIVEIKNLNSFRFVEKALIFEEKRLKDKYPDWPKTVKKVTRGFDSTKGETYDQRHKEEAADYRYFPEPDLPPFESEKLIPEAKKLQQLSIQDKVKEIENKAGLSSAEALAAVDNKKIGKIIWVNINQPFIAALAKLIIHSPELINNESILIKYAKEITAGKISAGFAKQKIASRESSKNAAVDDNQIRLVIKKIIKESPEAVDKFKSGKSNLLGFFVGQVMKEFKGQADPQIINKIILEELKK